MITSFTKLLENIAGLSAYTTPIATVLAFIIMLGIAIIAAIIAKRVIVVLIHKLLSKSETTRDDILVRNKVFERLSNLAPALVVYALAPSVFSAYPVIGVIVVKLSLIYMVFVSVLFLDTLINSGLEIYKTFKISSTFPITSFIQIIKLIIYGLGCIIVLSLLLNKSPLTFFAGLGAMAAVFMFVFKDPILGFVAGIQLTGNRMVAVGDWIEMPKYGVDGDVIEIALTTVKIRNFDKTITTIPTYSLISDSFKNWRGMQETGGRRIKRSIYIDVTSVKFCDEEMLERFSKVQYIEDYITKKRDELQTFNKKANIDDAALVNGRRMTNLGTFRAYLESYLRNHPEINRSLTLLVRQLQPTEHGLPIEIYVFTKTIKWLDYESIQADIFDHIFAAAREFDLTLFQNPTGGDFRKILSM